MKANWQTGIYNSECEDLELFCEKLLTEYNLNKQYNPKIIGNYMGRTIYVGPNDTVETLIKQYKEELK